MTQAPVLVELDRLIEAMQSRIPANPLSPANLKKADRLERMLRDYFDALEQAFPYDELERLYYEQVKGE